MFFHPERMLAACELTICAMQRTTMSLMVGDLHRIEVEKKKQRENQQKKKRELWEFALNLTRDLLLTEEPLEQL